MSSLAELRIPLRPFVQVLSNVVDLVGVDDHAHARRVAYLAMQLGRALDHAEDRQQRLYEAASLHDCGVSSTREHNDVMGGVAWAEAQHHCRLGDQRLRGFAPLADLADIVLHHHSPWSMLVGQDLPLETARDANLIFLADRIDAVSRPYQSSELLAHTEHVRTILVGFGNDVFEPQLMGAFLDLSAAEAFWIPLMALEEVFAFHAEHSAEPAGRVLDWAQFKQGARLIADIVDAKSRFTHQHSIGVACLSRFLAEQAGMAEEDCERIEVAGLLHDLGKLHIPDEILEAPRGLSDSEWHQMRTHSYLTYEILKPLEAIEALAHWAAGHHERLNGTGYPYRIQQEELPLPMRILAVADVYQALAQQRPYRNASPPTEVLQALDGLVAEQAVDGNIVAIVRAQLEACQRAAFGGFGSNGGGKGTEAAVLA